MRRISLLVLLVVFGLLSVWAQSGLQSYPPVPGLKKYRSTKYQVTVQAVSHDGLVQGESQYSPVYYLEGTGNGANKMSHSHWTTFSFSPDELVAKVKVEVLLQSGNISNCEFRPTHVSHIEKDGNRLSFQIESDKYTSLIINDDIRNPLFVFCDPDETHVPDTSSSDVFVVKQGSTTKENPLTIRDIGSKKVVCFEIGEHWINETDKHGYTPQNYNEAFFVCGNGGNRINNNKIEQIYIPGGALVHGNVRATRAQNLMVNGRGIIEGEDTYAYASGDYFSGQILNSAICMAAYHDKNGERPETMNQVVEGITSILPRKYNFQLGIGAEIRNTKCFAYHQTTDGIGVEENSFVSNNFMKVNDDALKLYQDNCVFENNYIWHQMNGAAMQLGWDKEEGDVILVKNTYLLHDDMYEAGYFNEGFWANQSIICWLKHVETFDHTRENIVIDGINNIDMPLVGVVRVLAIAMDGEMGGSGQGNLDMVLRNIVVGEENVKTPSYVAAANNRYSNVYFEQCTRNGDCMTPENVEARGNIDGVSITSDYCGTPTYEILVTNSAGGTVRPGTSQVVEGGSQLFVFEPYIGFKVGAVWVDEISQGTAREFRFEDVQQDHTLHVEFVSESTGVEYKINGISIYPNPVTDYLNIELYEGVNSASIVIFNLDGQKVYSTAVVNQKTKMLVDDFLGNGEYIVQVYSNETLMRTEKITVCR